MAKEVRTNILLVKHLRKLYVSQFMRRIKNCIVFIALVMPIVMFYHQILIWVMLIRSSHANARCKDNINNHVHTKFCLHILASALDVYLLETDSIDLAFNDSGHRYFPWIIETFISSKITLFFLQCSFWCWWKRMEIQKLKKAANIIAWLFSFMNLSDCYQLWHTSIFCCIFLTIKRSLKHCSTIRSNCFYASYAL